MSLEENGRDAIAGGGGGGEAREGITTVLVGRRRGAHLAVGCGVAREDDVTDVAVPSTRHDMTAAVAADDDVLRATASEPRDKIGVWGRRLFRAGCESGSVFKELLAIDWSESDFVVVIVVAAAAVPPCEETEDDVTAVAAPSMRHDATAAAAD
eukprot:CAMPEP_0172519330 /NCGR_PEP_ID=MMETSP1066-20121228/291347_1 /TAXON_ID=671091 /ORGANISM="Coscinodiscus wailesii, Strain CCMP2513" /LENGTH=153 /DNA_ID=CAMNT_0013301897 /DNA_START=419 /DNA_END=882 /DNA_ORIENTATION=-